MVDFATAAGTTAAPTPPSASPAVGGPRARRLLSVDAYRGLVMLLLFGEALRLCDVARALPQSALWQELCRQQSHAQWVGLHLHDLIQPGFTFLVGASIPLSIAARRAIGMPAGQLIGHAVLRSLLLIVLGIVMTMSMHPIYIRWKFEDTLCQIGLGYAFVFCLALTRPRTWWFSFWGILLASWLFFALSPLPGADFDYAAVGVSAEWLAQHGLTGWQAHWQKNANIAYAFDLWLLPMLPGNEHYVARAGLTTLNFVPTMATMILGLAAGHRLMRPLSDRRKLRGFLLAAGVGLALGGLLAWTGVSPLIKSLWTPSWVLVSGAFCLVFLAFFFYLVEMRGARCLVLPLVVIGANSLFAYVLQHMYPALAWGTFSRLFGPAPFELLGAAMQPLLYGLVVLAFYWTLLYLLWRRRWFIRI
jgi:heparan-alpha-glucosaminide N-acetyltransferase